MENDSKKGDGGCGSASPSAAGDGGGGGSVMRWERFLPKMALRVLLVDADDSTRQIIAALLRKCSYRVASVPDGLKAWEVLKARAHNIDLILTEVDLPSISGFALLTLIMEHDICKNIPVIMMSSQDSVSTVYKCMLKGAADFLVKPIRKNELRNLWQHVWRKQALSGAGPGPPEESVAQQNFEATAENSNPSSGSMACGQRNRECIEKESDAQSSCGKPEMPTEGADIECMQNLSQQIGSKSLSSDVNVQQREGLLASRNVQMPQGPRAAAEDIACQTMTRREAMNADDRCQQGKFIGQTPDNNHDLDDSCREAMDLIGAFDNNRKCTNGSSSSNINASNIDPSPSFELSLRRSHPSGSVDQDTDEKYTINPSDALAFSRYIYRTSHPPLSASPSTSKQRKCYETNSTSIPMKGISFENLSNASGPVKQPTDYMQSGLSPMQNEYKQEHYLETLENRGYFSSAADQIAYSSFCDGGVSQLHCINHESKDIVNPVVPVTSEYGKEEAFPTHDGNSHRSTLREAALNKFRLKRKERCYGKKVRYESRKKLAEQRPRVKGQFVRQTNNEPPTGS